MVSLGGVLGEVKHVENWAPPVAGVGLGIVGLSAFNSYTDDQIVKKVAKNPAAPTAEEAKTIRQYATAVRVGEAVAGILLIAASSGGQSGWKQFGLTTGAVVTFLAGKEAVEYVMAG